MLRALLIYGLLISISSLSVAQDGVKRVVIGDPNSPDFGAEIPIKGKVVNLADKQPVIGAVIEVPFLKTGTITDVNGRYTLRLPQGNHRIVFHPVQF